jgi:thioester reductase-like protein
MLEYILKDTDVKKVYCCIRGKQDQLSQRLQDAFTSRSLDASLLTSDRVEVLPMRFNEPLLGFSQERYDQLREEVTMVQHCAWLLDFNMPVDHYDKECIAPFYNLLKFAYKQVNPMHVHFISSISASAAYGPEIPEEPLPLDPSVTMPMGYAQSKFIVEVLFDYLTTEKNFPCYIERLGQVCGDSVNGVWNRSEQYPLMFVGGGSVMHKMPALDTVIDWITVDYAAKTIADIMLRRAYSASNRDESIYHIVNPQLVNWSDVLEAMSASGMKFETVAPLEWVESLAKDDSNPAYTLMSFYDANFKESFKMPVWKTEKTAAAAPVIDQSPVLDAALFTKFLNRWESIGFYNPSA